MQRMILFIGLVLGLASAIVYLAASNAVKMQDNLEEGISLEGQTELIQEIKERVPYQLQSELDFEGKALVVNLWATWCGPCRKEIPELNSIVAQANSDKVLFLAYSDEDQQVYNSLLESNPRIKFDYTLVFDHLPLGDYLKSLDRQNRGESIPVHYLIRPNGSLAHVLVGNKTSHLRKIESFVKEYN